MGQDRFVSSAENGLRWTSNISISPKITVVVAASARNLIGLKNPLVLTSQPHLLKEIMSLLTISKNSLFTYMQEDCFNALVCCSFQYSANDCKRIRLEFRSTSICLFEMTNICPVHGMCSAIPNDQFFIDSVWSWPPGLGMTHQGSVRLPQNDRRSRKCVMLKWWSLHASRRLQRLCSWYQNCYVQTGTRNEGSYEIFQSFTSLCNRKRNSDMWYHLVQG